jgi:2,3-dihydroxybenzoate decarboxylase
MTGYMTAGRCGWSRWKPPASTFRSCRSSTRGQEDDDVARAVDYARRANDDLAESVRENPDRFGAFATLATQDPDAAADELQRAVTDLGCAGALINGRTHDRNLDDSAYEGLFERAETLGVPIYLHPTTPHPAVMDA